MFKCLQSDYESWLISTAKGSKNENFSDNGLSHTSASSTLGLAYQWYMSCRGCHRTCSQRSKRSRWYPTRLIDIGAKGDTEWKIINTSGRSLASPNYVTLSYRWGFSPALKLTCSTTQEFYRGMPFSILPQTYKDTVKIARRFSVRYIWIDSLCIFQDSREDWERESSTMRDVYANSACNIAATASTNPEGGLFRERQLRDVQPGNLTVSLLTPEEENYCVLEGLYWNCQITNAPLHRRGWVFQECILAPRVLYFGKDQILWECFKERKCEAFPQGIPLIRTLKNLELFSYPADTNTDTNSPLSRDAFEFWNQIVDAYSQCELTRSNDKLIALSGLAHLFQAVTGEEYIAGLWKSRLKESLDWRVYKPRAKVSSSYHAPSWSWASIDGPVYPCGITTGSTYLIDILDTGVSNSKIDPLGQVYNGFIVVKGVLTETIYYTLDQGNSACILEANGYNLSAFVYGDTSDTHLEGGTLVHCLALKSYPTSYGGFSDSFALMGLVLQRELETAGEFSRIGHFHMNGVDAIERFGIHIGSENTPLSTVESSVIKII